jgi:6-phosphogluconolactonase (cycloisomerase 2 family)
MSIRNALMLLATVSWPIATSQAAPTVVIESNAGNQNTLLSFGVQADGSLQMQNSFPTSGQGIVDPSLALGPFDSDQQIVVDRSRNLLFAVNGGSNSIAVFQIGMDGSLTQVSNSPFDSHGVQPASLGISGDKLIVVNKHQDPAQAMDQSLPNYTSFFIKSTGELVWTGNEVEVAAGSSPSQALISPLANVMIGADFLGGLVRSFDIQADGKLQQIFTMGIPSFLYPNTATPRLPLGLIAHPSKPLVYVGLPTANKIAVYKYDIAGNLNYVSATNDSGQVVCWLLMNREGTRLYASNTADASITVYDTQTDPENPMEIQKVKINSMGGAYQIALSPDESYFAVLTQRFQASTPQGSGNELHVFPLNPKTGKLKEQDKFTNLSLPQDVRPQGLVIL